MAIQHVVFWVLDEKSIHLGSILDSRGGVYFKLDLTDYADSPTSILVFGRKINTSRFDSRLEGCGGVLQTGFD